MKSLLLLILLVIIAVSGCVETTTTTIPVASFISYENDVYGISVEYPDDWGISENYMGGIVAFASLFEGADDRFAENVNIFYEPLPNDTITLDEYAGLSISFLEDYFNDFELLESKNTLINNMLAKRLVYTYDQGTYIIKIMQILIVRDKEAFVITYTAESEKYDDYLDIADHIIQSFRLTS